MSSRVCFFAHYDKTNIISEYVVYYIRSLKDVCEKIIFVSTSNNLAKSEQEKLIPYVDHCIVKKNEGYDFGSWKSGMEYVGFDNILMYDQVIIANDSCFGPIYSLGVIFDKMSNKQCDAWSMTENYINARHMQSYFIVMSGHLFREDWFKKFWSGVTVQHMKIDYITKYEVGLSKLLTAHNKRFLSHYMANFFEAIMFTMITFFYSIHTSVIKLRSGKTSVNRIKSEIQFERHNKIIGTLYFVIAILKRFVYPNIIFLCPTYLVKRGIPLLKTATFKENPCRLNLNKLLPKLKKFIQDKTNYPFSLIDDYIKEQRN